MENKKKVFLILDCNSILHRVYHALPPLTTKEGKPVGAVYGFLSVLGKAIREIRPDYIVACFDYPGLTIRHKEFEKYKAKRPPLNPDLKSQIPLVKESLLVLRIPIFERKGYEADDIIGNIVEKINKRYIFPKIEVKILTGDLDLLQLIEKNVEVLLMKTGEKEFVKYNKEKVREKYKGLSPKQIVDFKALRGDPSDNIPGVRGIGEKTAIELLKNFGSLQNLYREIEQKTEKSKEIPSKIREFLISQKNQAFLSYSLASLKKDAKIDFSLGNKKWGSYKKEEFINFLQKLGFKSLIKRFFPDEVKEQKRETINIQKKLIN